MPPLLRRRTIRGRRDEAWTTDARIAAEGHGDAVRFIRGVAFGAVAGVVLWALAALALFLSLR